MSMPSKGKHHFAHHQSPNQTHIQAQHGLNIAQSSVTINSQSPTYPSVVNSNRYAAPIAPEFHLTGQSYAIQQSGLQSGTSGNNLSGGTTNTAARTQVLPNLTGVRHSLPGMTNSQLVQTPLNLTATAIQKQVPQASMATSAVCISKSQDTKSSMQTPTPPLQHVFISRNTQNFPANSRPPQGRNINSRNGQLSSSNQVSNLPGVTTTGQPNLMYSHPSLSLQPTTMYIPSQVSAIHSSPHQQNVYAMNNQLSMQYPGPQTRPQGHPSQFTNQFPYPGVFSFTGYSQGNQPSYYYNSPGNPPIVGRSVTTPNTTHHLTANISNTTATPVIAQNTLQAPVQQHPVIPPISLAVTQPAGAAKEGFPNYNSGTIPNQKLKKHLRTKAIIDIVDPNTGKNISADIYDDNQISDRNVEGMSLQSNSDKRVVADFAAQVAKAASEPGPGSMNDPLDYVVVEDIETNDSHSVDQKCSHVCPSDDSETLKGESAISLVAEISCGEGNPTHTSEDNLKGKDRACQNILNLAVITDTHSNDAMELERIDNEIMDPKTEVHPENLSQASDMPSLSKIQHYEEDKAEDYQINELKKCVSSDSTNTTEGKIMQKQKSKKSKSRDSHRKGIEKEASEMNTLVESVIPALVNEADSNQVTLSKENDPETFTDKIKNINQKERSESTKDSDVSVNQPSDSSGEGIIKKNTTSIGDDNVIHTDETKFPLIVDDLNEKKYPNETSRSLDIDHSSQVFTSQKNNENIFHNLHVSSTNQESVTKSITNENSNDIEIECTPDNKLTYLKSDIIQNLENTISKHPNLKYTYGDDQWSPINTSGKKVYDREFLMKLQDDPSSKIKPSNLPDLDVVLKDCTKSRSIVETRYKDAKMQHENLLPTFVKSGINSKSVPSAKKNHPSKIKANKTNVIHVSLSLKEDVKLRETKNAWKPARLIQSSTSEEEAKTKALYKKVRSVLNKLTPQKFDTLVNQVRDLEIDTQERLQGVINLVFEKAVDEPNFSVAYALMCSELSNMAVNKGTEGESSSANFRKLILTRCQEEFEKNNPDEDMRLEKLSEQIEACADPEKKKELQLSYDEEARRMRVKSVGNIRFIGELFKQRMLTFNIMFDCIKHLLKEIDEENLECLCKLLTTIGKVLDTKAKDELNDYFEQMQQLANNKKGKISSRIRFMLQDVIDLRANKWIPRRDDGNPKTIDQIQKEAESERLDIQLNSMSTPRKDDRNVERKRNRGTYVEDGWSHPVGRTRSYSVETSKLKNKMLPMDDMQLGNRQNYQWNQKPDPKMTTPNKFGCLDTNLDQDHRTSNLNIIPSSRHSEIKDSTDLSYKYKLDTRGMRNENYSTVSSTKKESTALGIANLTVAEESTTAEPDKSLSIDELETVIVKVIEEFVSKNNLKEAIRLFCEKCPVPNRVSFIKESINKVLEKSENHREKTSILLSQLLQHNHIRIDEFISGFGELLESAKDLIIDIPKLWNYLAKILLHPIIDEIFPFGKIGSLLEYLPDRSSNTSLAGEMIAELLSEIMKVKDPQWVNSRWKESNLKWEDLVNNEEKRDYLMKHYQLQCILSSPGRAESTNWTGIKNQLSEMMISNSFDEICSWIQENIEGASRDLGFIRLLMTSILEVSTEIHDEVNWNFKVERFDALQKLILRYVDAVEDLELQCLFAIQEFVHKYNNPQGLIQKIVTNLNGNNVLSNEAFLSWEKNTDPAETRGKLEALNALREFFVPLKEGEPSSSDENS